MTAVAAMQVGSSSALEMTGVKRNFGALQALVDIDLSIRAGERRALLGSNGAGKTTLFNAISGDFPPNEGRIRFFGEDITDYAPQERIRRGLRRTYQISLLFDGLSVLENLYLACRGVSRGRYSLLRATGKSSTSGDAERLLESVHLQDLRDNRVSTLSHGQQRQLEIGMALAGAPRLILFDEPAAGLSPRERAQLIEILTNLPSHIGYIIVEHDLDVALRVVESVTMMHNGGILMEGTPAEIESNELVQQIYLGQHHA